MNLHRLSGDSDLSPWAAGPPGSAIQGAGLDPSVMARPSANYMAVNSDDGGPNTGRFGMSRSGRRDVRTRLGGRDSRGGDRSNNGNRHRHQRSRSPKRRKKSPALSKSSGRTNTRFSDRTDDSSKPNDQIDSGKSSDSNDANKPNEKTTIDQDDLPKSDDQSESIKTSEQIDSSKTNDDLDDSSKTNDNIESVKNKDINEASKDGDKSESSKISDASESSKSNNDRKRSSKRPRSLSSERDLEQLEYEKLPIEALNCKLCEMTKFDNVKAFRNHLKSRNHMDLYQEIKGKGLFLLSIHRADVKIAESLKQYKQGRKVSKRSEVECPTCWVPVVTTLEDHYDQPEHKVMKVLNSLQCCNKTIGSAVDLQNHYSSIEHLKQMFEDEEAKHVDTITTEDDVMLQDLSIDNPLPYNPDTYFADRYLEKQILYHCDICSLKLPPKLTSAQEHCATREHYDKLKEYLKKKKGDKVAEEPQKDNKTPEVNSSVELPPPKVIPSPTKTDVEMEDEWGSVEEVGEVLEEHESSPSPKNEANVDNNEEN